MVPLLHNFLFVFHFSMTYLFFIQLSQQKLNMLQTEFCNTLWHYILLFADGSNKRSCTICGFRILNLFCQEGLYRYFELNLCVFKIKIYMSCKKSKKHKNPARAFTIIFFQDFREMICCPLNQTIFLQSLFVS